MKRHPLYLDIETTGLSPERNEVTIVGAFDGKELHQLIKGITLEEKTLQKLFHRTDKIVSYNGKRFDVPFIQHNFPKLCIECEHHDLMHTAWSRNLYGGLKKVERMLGIGREAELSGKDAVRLWKEYERGDSDSLKKLLDYNAEDVLNLVRLEKVLES